MFADLFEVVETLVFYDGPLTYTFFDGGELHLAYWAERHDDHEIYMVSPITEREVDALKRGTLTPREFLLRDQVKTVRVGRTGQAEIIKVAREKFLEWVPDEGVRLWDEDAQGLG